MKSVQKVEGKGKCQQKEEKGRPREDKGGKVGKKGNLGSYFNIYVIKNSI